MSKEITCNCCGKRFDFWDYQENFSIHRIMGYGSRHDGEEVELDICCDCMDAIIDSCKISPIVADDDPRPVDTVPTRRCVGYSEF